MSTTFCFKLRILLYSLDDDQKKICLHPDFCNHLASLIYKKQFLWNSFFLNLNLEFYLFIHFYSDVISDFDNFDRESFRFFSCIVINMFYMMNSIDVP